MENPLDDVFKSLGNLQRSCIIMNEEYNKQLKRIAELEDRIRELSSTGDNVIALQKRIDSLLSDLARLHNEVSDLEEENEELESDIEDKQYEIDELKSQIETLELEAEEDGYCNENLQFDCQTFIDFQKAELLMKIYKNFTLSQIEEKFGIATNLL